MTYNWVRVKQMRVENISIFIGATDDDGSPIAAEERRVQFQPS